MSFQVNEARNKWIEYLINFTEVWGKIIEAKKRQRSRTSLCQNNQYNTEAQKVRPTMTFGEFCI